MDLIEQKQKFDDITAKYGLTAKADEIADVVVGKKISVSEFATLFGLEHEDAELYLSFILKGLEFKEKYVDIK